MLHLLRDFAGPSMTNATEIHALDVMEEIVAGNREMLDAINEIRREIHPVEKAKKNCAAVLLEQETKVASCEAEISELTARIERMRAELTEKKKARQQQQPQQKKRPLSDVVIAAVREEESQLFECTQPDQAEGQEKIALLGDNNFTAA